MSKEIIYNGENENFIFRKNKIVEVTHEEQVIIHNAVIFMANDLMEEIQELEAWLKDAKERKIEFNHGMKEAYEKELNEKNRRWNVMINITKKVKQRE